MAVSAFLCPGASLHKDGLTVGFYGLLHDFVLAQGNMIRFEGGKFSTESSLERTAI